MDEPNRKSGSVLSLNHEEKMARSKPWRTSHFGPPAAPRITFTISGLNPFRLIECMAFVPA
jgi:hypothetical protein